MSSICLHWAFRMLSRTSLFDIFWHHHSVYSPPGRQTESTLLLSTLMCKFEWMRCSQAGHKVGQISLILMCLCNLNYQTSLKLMMIRDKPKVQSNQVKISMISFSISGVDIHLWFWFEIALKQMHLKHPKLFTFTDYVIHLYTNQ